MKIEGYGLYRLWKKAGIWIEFTKSILPGLKPR
jgi:hypothetical protein